MTMLTVHLQENGRTYFHNKLLELKALLPDENIDRQLQHARSYMEQHFAAAINLDDIARHCCLSKFHFVRLFKSYYGRTPHQYLIGIRIREAKKLLRQGKSIQDSCFAVGFNSVTSFTGLFRRMAGCNPSMFRKNVAG